MGDVKKEYNAAWNSSRHCFFDNNIFVDPFLSDLKNDNRRGLTVLIQLDGEILHKFSQIITDFKMIEPRQYFYPLSDVHVTVIDLIGASKDFVFKQDLVEKYKNILSRVFKDTRGFSILFNGLCATRGAIFAQGFAGQHIQKTRDTIRLQIAKEGLTLQERVSGNFVHSCLVRFKEPLQNPESIVQFVDQSRALKIGTFNVKKVLFVLHDWYNRKEQTRLLFQYDLL